MDDGEAGHGGGSAVADRDGLAEFAELATRLGAALTAIQGAAEGRPTGEAGADDSARIAELEDELETERSVNSQLEDRIQQIKARHEATVARIEAETVEARAMLAEAESELRQLRAANERLRETSRGLRDAFAAGAVEGSTINEAMRLELDTLRGAREADRREMDRLIGELAPLVERESA